MVRFSTQSLWFHTDATLCSVSFAWAQKSKLHPHLIDSRSIVVFRELFQHLFGDSYPNKILFLFKDMGVQSFTHPSQF